MSTPEMWRTQAEVAAMLNVSEAAISKRMRKIGDRVSVRQNGRRREINVAEYRAAVNATVDLIRQQAQGVDLDALPGEDLFRPPAQPASPVDARATPPALAPAAPPARLTEGQTLSAEQTRRMRVQADIDELRLAEMRGQVLKTAIVVDAMARCAEAMTRRINQLPQRAAEVAAAMQENGEAGVRAVLKTLAREWLTALADDMRLIEQQAPDTDPDD